MSLVGSTRKTRTTQPSTRTIFEQMCSRHSADKDEDSTELCFDTGLSGFPCATLVFSSRKQTTVHFECDTVTNATGPPKLNGDWEGKFENSKGKGSEKQRVKEHGEPRMKKMIKRWKAGY